MTEFADRVRELMERRRMTQEEVAERGKMPLRHFQRMLEGKYKIKLMDAAQVALALDTNTNYLAGLTTDDRPVVDEASLSLGERIALRVRAGDKVGAIRLIADEEPPDQAQTTNPQT